MKRSARRKEKIDFTLKTKEYRKLHLFLYFTSTILILFFYLLLILVFSNYSQNTFLTVMISLFIGVYLVLNRDKLVTYISHYLYERERKKLKKQNKEGLKKTIRRLVPKRRKIKLNIKEKVSLRDKMKKIKKKFQKKDKNKPDYIEIE